MATRDDADFVEYVAARERGLRRTAYGLTGDPGVATDVVAEALARVYVAWPRFEREGGLDDFTRDAVVSVAGDRLRRRGGPAGEAGEPDAGPAVDAQDVLDAGRRRLRRRRTRVLAGSVAVVVAAGLTVGAGLLGQRHSHAAGPGSFQRVPVPRDQALHRCDASVARSSGGLSGLSLLRGPGTDRDGGRVANPQEPWFEGTVLYYAAAGGPGSAVPCMVPAAGAEDPGARPPHEATPGTAEFRDECATASGFDLTGWRDAAAAGAHTEAVGLFVSTNGWTLQCRYQPSSGAGDVAPVTLELGGPGGAPGVGPTGNRVWLGCHAFLDDFQVFEGGCYGTGAAVDHGRRVASLRVSMPGGTRTVPVQDGYYAFAFDGPDVRTSGVAPRQAWTPYAQATVTSLDAQGREIATHGVTMIPAFSPL